MTGQIQYLQRQKINISKWDRCITMSGNGLIYGYSWWLDEMAENWDALVLNDYEAIMPLIWRETVPASFHCLPGCIREYGAAWNNHGLFTIHSPAVPFLGY